MELIYLLFSCPQLCAHNCVWHLNCVRQCALTIATQDNPADLWQLRHWLQFLQLRIWIHDNICYLTIKSDTGQHLQFLQCLFYLYQFEGIVFSWNLFVVEFGWSYVEITNDGAFAQFQGSHNLQIRPNFKDSRLAEMMTYENSMGYLHADT